MVSSLLDGFQLVAEYPGVKDAMREIQQFMTQQKSFLAENDLVAKMKASESSKIQTQHLKTILSTMQTLPDEGKLLLDSFICKCLLELTALAAWPRRFELSRGLDLASG